MNPNDYTRIKRRYLESLNVAQAPPPPSSDAQPISQSLPAHYSLASRMEQEESRTPSSKKNHTRRTSTGGSEPVAIPSSDNSAHRRSRATSMPFAPMFDLEDEDFALDAIGDESESDSYDSSSPPGFIPPHELVQRSDFSVQRRGEKINLI